MKALAEAIELASVAVPNVRVALHPWWEFVEVGDVVDEFGGGVAGVGGFGGYCVC